MGRDSSVPFFRVCRLVRGRNTIAILRPGEEPSIAVGVVVVVRRRRGGGRGGEG